MVVVIGVEVGGVLRGEVAIGSVTVVEMGSVTVAVEKGLEIGDLGGEECVP